MPLPQVQQVLAASGAQPGDLLLVAAGPAPLVHRTLDRVRQYVARQLGMVDDKQNCLLWITGVWGGLGAACAGLHVLVCMCWVHVLPGQLLHALPRTRLTGLTGSISQ